MVNTGKLQTLLILFLFAFTCQISAATDTASSVDHYCGNGSRSNYLISTPQIVDPYCPLNHVSLSADKVRVRSAVLTVADPLESRLGRAFDSQLAAIIRAFHTRNYVLDGFALTWRLNRAREVPLDLHQGTGIYKEQHRSRPGVLLFRKDLWRQPKRNASDYGADYFVAFLVGESPTFGVHPVAFKEAVLCALQLTGVLDKNVLSRNCNQAFNSLNHQQNVLDVIGPTFSGSIESIALVLGSVLREVAPSVGKEKIDIAVNVTSPSATVPSNKNMAWRTEQIAGRKLNLRYRSLAFTIESQLRALADYRGRVGEKLVILAEESTFGYGVSEFIRTLDCTGKGYSCTLLENARVINFPQNIAAVRAEHSRIDQEKSADLRRTFKAATRLLELDLSTLEEITDRPPAYRRELSSRSDELMLYGTFDAMRVWVKPTIVAIVATDIRDRLFLLNEVRKSLPSALPVLMEMDYLTAHPDYRKISRGVLSIPNGETLLCLKPDGQLTECFGGKKPKAYGNSTPEGHKKKTFLSFPSDYSASMFRAVHGVIDDSDAASGRASEVNNHAQPKLWVSTLAGFQTVGTEGQASSRLLVADGRLLLERPVPILFLLVGILIVAIAWWLQRHGRVHLIMLQPLRHLNPFPGVREADFQPDTAEQESSTDMKSLAERLNKMLSILLMAVGVVVSCTAAWRLLFVFEKRWSWPLAHGRDQAMLGCLVLVFISIAVVAGWRIYLWQGRRRALPQSFGHVRATASAAPAIRKYGRATPGLAAVVIVLLVFASLFSGLPASVDSPVPAMLTGVTLILVGIWFLAELLYESNRLAQLALRLAPTLDWPAKHKQESPVRPTNPAPADSWASPMRLAALPQSPFSLRFRKRDLAALLAYPDDEWKKQTRELVQGTWPFKDQGVSFEDWQARLVAEMRYALAAIRCCAWTAILAPTVVLLATGIYPPFNERLVTTSSVLLIFAAFAVTMYVIIKFEQSPLLGRMFTLNGDRLSISGAIGALWGKLIAAAVILIPVLFPDVLSVIYRLLQSIDSLQ